jgi:type II secretory pathway pseudopilin PulG
MTCAILILCILGAWAMLSLMGTDRKRRLGEMQQRLRAEAATAALAEAEARAKAKSEQIISVG